MRLLHELYTTNPYRKQGYLSKGTSDHIFVAYEYVLGFSFIIVVSQPACNLDSSFHTNC